MALRPGQLQRRPTRRPAIARVARVPLQTDPAAPGQRVARRVARLLQQHRCSIGSRSGLRKVSFPVICDVELTTRRPRLAEGFQDIECARSGPAQSTVALLPLVAPECFDGSSGSCLVKPDFAMRTSLAPRLTVHLVRKYVGKIVTARRDVDVRPAGFDLERLVTASTIRSARWRPCTAWRITRCRAATAALLLLRSPSARRVSPKNIAASSAASSSFKRATAAARALTDNAGSIAAILAAQSAPMACALLAVALAD